MSCVDEQKAVFEQLTLSDFKMWSSTAFKTFDSYTIIMNNNTDNVKRKNIFACLFSVHNTISLSRHEQVCLMRLRLERYFSHHRAT